MPRSASVLIASPDQAAVWTRAGELTFAIDRVPLSEIESAWQRGSSRGRRLVVQP
jgi:NADPH2:quinone reductase